MEKLEGRGIQSIEVGGRLLSELVGAVGPLMLKDLAARADLAPAQAHAYLASFRRVGLVEQSSETGMYSIGPAAVGLAVARMLTTEPTASARKAAVDLAKVSGMMVAVAMWGPHAPTAVLVLEGEGRLNVNVRSGSIFAVTLTPVGWIFDAFGDRRLVQERVAVEVAGVINHVQSDRIARRRTSQERADIRKRGFAACEDSPVPGMSSVAAPVFAADQSLAYAISLIGESDSFDVTSGGRHVSALLETTGRLSTAPTR